MHHGATYTLNFGAIIIIIIIIICKSTVDPQLSEPQCFQAVIKILVNKQIISDNCEAHTNIAMFH